MSARRGTVVLAAGSAVSGLLAYVVFALVTRGLGPAEAAPVSVLWTYWAFAGAALTFPLQHWITRVVVSHGEQAVRRAAPRVALVVVLLALVVAGLAWLARDLLFGRQDAWFPAMTALLTVGSALIGVTRGGLGAEGRFAAVGVSLVAENGLRVLLVGGLLLAGVRTAPAHGLCLVAGQLVVALWPSALRYARTGPTTEQGARPDDRPTPASPAAGPLAFLGGAGVAQLLSQVLLTGGPVLLALSGGSARQVTSLFAALALFRAPYMLALASVPQLTLRTTRLQVAGQHAVVSAWVGRLLVVSVGVAVLGAGFGALVGPWIVRLVFGAAVVIGRTDAALVSAASTLAVATLVLVVVALAHDRAGPVAWAWVATVAVTAVGFLLLAPVAPVGRTVGTFVVAEVAAFALVALVTLRATHRPSSPDSSAVAGLSPSRAASAPGAEPGGGRVYGAVGAGGLRAARKTEEPKGRS